MKDWVLGLFWQSGDQTRRRLPLAVMILNWIIAYLLIAAVGVYSFVVLGNNWDFQAYIDRSAIIWQAWVTTLQISLISLFLSLCFGFLALLMRRSHLLLLRPLGRTYVEFIRGTPLLVQIQFGFYVLGTAFHIGNRFLVGCVVLAFFAGAYISEILRGGLDSIGVSQLDSARAIGFNPQQIFRFVVFPQAIRVVLPGLAGMFASLVKDSSLLSVISIGEFYWRTDQIKAITYTNFECYVLLAIGYLILTLPISLFTQWLETRIRYET